ncbi:MAG: serine hydrolase domain-containing protein, partial [Cyclobacteriaceae bacterium]
MKLLSNFAALCLISIVGCQAPTSKTSEIVEIKGSPDYMPPVFTDKERLEKISQTFPVADKIYKDFAERNHYPSIAYGLIVDGKMIHSGASGEANRETGQAPTTKTLYRIASMSKSFTAMAILKLRDEGKLDLQDPAH